MKGYLRHAIVFFALFGAVFALKDVGATDQSFDRAARLRRRRNLIKVDAIRQVSSSRIESSEFLVADDADLELDRILLGIGPFSMSMSMGMGMGGIPSTSVDIDTDIDTDTDMSMSMSMDMGMDMSMSMSMSMPSEISSPVDITITTPTPPSSGGDAVFLPTLPNELNPPPGVIIDIDGIKIVDSVSVTSTTRLTVGTSASSNTVIKVPTDNSGNYYFYFGDIGEGSEVILAFMGDHTNTKADFHFAFDSIGENSTVTITIVGEDPGNEGAANSSSRRSLSEGGVFRLRFGPIGDNSKVAIFVPGSFNFPAGNMDEDGDIYFEFGDVLDNTEATITIDEDSNIDYEMTDLDGISVDVDNSKIDSVETDDESDEGRPQWSFFVFVVIGIGIIGLVICILRQSPKKES